jgi:Ulp1 family protease
MQDNGCDCGVFLCKHLLAMYQLQHDSIPFCTLFGSDAPLQFLTDSVQSQFNSVDISKLRSNLVQLLY